MAVCNFTMTNNPRIICQDSSVDCSRLVSDMYTPRHSLRFINQGRSV